MFRKEVTNMEEFEIKPKTPLLLRRMTKKPDDVTVLKTGQKITSSMTICTTSGRLFEMTDQKTDATRSDRD